MNCPLVPPLFVNGNLKSDEKEEIETNHEEIKDVDH
jgi:hypothetical protein